jgi:hypothetical protein
MLVCGTMWLARGSVVFDNSGQPQKDVSDREAGDSPLTFISAVSTDIEITGISVLNRFESAGNLKFLIFDDATGTLLYQSTAKSFGADTDQTWKSSDDLSFTLLAGHTYDIGAIADTHSLWSYAFEGATFSQSGITSGPGNANAANFGAPTQADVGGGLGGDIPLVLGGSIAADPPVGAVPESSTWTLIAGGLAGLVLLDRRTR